MNPRIAMLALGGFLAAGCGESGPPAVRTAPNGDFKSVRRQVWGKSRAEVRAALGEPFGKRREKDGTEYWFYDLVVEDDEPETRGRLLALHFIWNADGAWRGIGMQPPDGWHAMMTNEARFPPDRVPE